MVTNYKPFIILCVIFLMCFTLWSCYNKGKNMDENTNNFSMQSSDNEDVVKITSSNKTRILQLDDIKLSSKLTRKQVLDDWGPPDSKRGSGIDWWEYKLNDGRLLWLWFDNVHPESLIKAIIFANSNDDVGKTIFDLNSDKKMD